MACYLDAAIREAFQSMRNAVTTSITVIALNYLINVCTSRNLLIMQKTSEVRERLLPL